ncbi:translation initiation factor [Zunongwangia sp. F363]|uniref:Translation initiation factor n=1 Tax=Autumnicola tepida TaxID=3075595 RepID=A0ABU3C667_9FLAO|nr:translation initiation factor [Zunongwangia sp. F363]MDT0641844.1 translation initiation factor [Zunongwangia sp. F363]
MAKKKLGLEDLGGFVFSTDEDFDENQYADDDQQKSLKPEEQELEAHFSSKGRGGKTVTIIKGFQGPEEDLVALGKKLKKKCGVGGSAKDGEIIIQGDDRDKIMQLLEKDGYNVKRVGG